MTKSVTIGSHGQTVAATDDGTAIVMRGEVRHSFRVSYSLVPALTVAHGRWINRYAPGARNGYWVAARFTAVDVEAQWSHSAGWRMHAAAQGWTLRRDGRQSAAFARTYFNTLVEARHSDSLTPPAILAAFDAAELLATKFDGWPLPPRYRCGCDRAMAERVGEHPLSCPARQLRPADPS
jgi:hypothetical protein